MAEALARARLFRVLALLSLGWTFVLVVVGVVVWVTAHLATAEALLAALTLLAVCAFAPERRLVMPRVLYAATAGAVYLLILTGAYVRGSNASLACPEWPLCGPSNIHLDWFSLLPLGGSQEVHMAHRYVAALVGGLLAVAVIV